MFFKYFNFLNNKNFIFISLFFIFLFSHAAFAAQTLQVGVAKGSSGVLLGSGVMTDAAGKRVNFSGATPISSAGNTISAGTNLMSLPVKVEGNNLGWDKALYRGALVLRQSGAGFAVVNVIDIELYLTGMSEMPSSWASEALKAQAIIARTYAAANIGRHRAEGFDVCSVSHCQTYRGVSAETAAAKNAVKGTEGLVLYYGNALASVYYHSDSGGATAEASGVWNTALPHLVARQEPVAYTSPHSSWQAALTHEQLNAIAAKLKINAGQVSGLRIYEKDAFGRAKTLEIIGSYGAARVKAHDFRMAAGPDFVKSTKFEIVGSNFAAYTTPNAQILENSQSAAAINEIMQSYSKPQAAPQTAPSPTPAKKPEPVSLIKDMGEDVLIQLTKQSIFTKDELLDMLLHPEKREQYVSIGVARIKGGSAAPTPTQPTQKQPNTQQGGGVILRGSGWGHGVGLSQWGAKALAEKGWSCEQILGHYFYGTYLKKQ